MKTTTGKTKAARPRARSVRIYGKAGQDRWRLIAVKKASTLKQALQEYYKETLQPRGYRKPLYNGNTLLVQYLGNEVNFMALELTQSPEEMRA